tara:strand:- start:409 stop:693 length:285 start_codon:yes stop_codon:yes gene_type:complete
MSSTPTKLLGGDPETMHALAGDGLVYMKDILNCSKITPADVMERFLGNHHEDIDHRPQLFCLTLTMLEMAKNGIDHTTYNKMFNKIVQNYAAES